MNIDYSKVGIGVQLPPLANGEPPTACPICGRRQIPPGSDDGFAPPDEPTYACGSSYLLAETEASGRQWEPCKHCYCATSRQALSWVREQCEAEPALAPVSRVIGQTLLDAPPYRTDSKSMLLVTLPPARGERAYEICPICGSLTSSFSEHLHWYTCGAGYGSTSLRPAPGGKMIPMTWAGMSPCPSASAEVILRVLRARNEPEWEAVCDEALAALPTP